MAKGKTDVTSLLRSKADTLRPLIHHLNADTGWLIQVPNKNAGSRVYFNVLVDAWLTGPQTEYSWIFHQQEHTIPSAFQTIAEVEAFVHEIEVRACALRGTDAQDKPSTGYIDVAACALRGTDHVNEETLRQLHPSVPVLVRHDAEHLVKNYKHFENITLLPPFQRDWRETRLPFLPDFIGIGCLTQKKDVQGIHKGLVISFDSTGLGEAEAIVYTPHGIPVEQMTFLTSRDPSLRVLALLHGLLNVRVGLSWIGFSEANLGAHNGLKLQRLLQAKYWIGTHDEAKIERGFTSYILTQNPITIEQALQQEKEEAGNDGFEQADPNWHPVDNGGSLVLT
ncbi:hypothetical protein MBLNU13_g11355t1 [Cladosporium sp. NU13]